MSCTAECPGVLQHACGLPLPCTTCTRLPMISWSALVRPCWGTLGCFPGPRRRIPWQDEISGCSGFKILSDAAFVGEYVLFFYVDVSRGIFFHFWIWGMFSALNTKTSLLLLVRLLIRYRLAYIFMFRCRSAGLDRVIWQLVSYNSSSLWLSISRLV